MWETLITARHESRHAGPRGWTGPVELRHLRYFLAVAHELHFSRAAERLHISQPPLSRQIQDLEREIGVALFRRNRRVELTEAGEQLLERAQRVVDALEEFSRAAEQVAAGMPSTLRVGYPATTADPIVSQAVRRFEAACPDVDLDLTVDGSGPHLRSLRADLLDTAFVRTTIDHADGLAHLQIADDLLVVVTPADDPLSSSDEVTQDQLRGARLVLPDPEHEPVLHAFLMDVVGDQRPAPTVVLQSCGIESVYSAVVAGLGSAIVPRSSAALLADDRVVFRWLRTTTAPPPLMLVWDADRVEHPLAAFLDEMAGLLHAASQAPDDVGTGDGAGPPAAARPSDGSTLERATAAVRISANGHAAADR